MGGRKREGARRTNNGRAQMKKQSFHDIREQITKNNEKALEMCKQMKENNDFIKTFYGANHANDERYCGSSTAAGRHFRWERGSKGQTPTAFRVILYEL